MLRCRLLCLPDGAHRVHGEARQRRACAAGEHGDAIIVARVRIGIHAGEDSAPLVVRDSSKRQNGKRRATKETRETTTRHGVRGNKGLVHGEW